jgi:hypothetical protein
MYFILPGMNLFKCRWKDSNDVEPRAQRNTGKVIPPVVKNKKKNRNA